VTLNFVAVLEVMMIRRILIGQRLAFLHTVGRAKLRDKYHLHRRLLTATNAYGRSERTAATFIPVSFLVYKGCDSRLAS